MPQRDRYVMRRARVQGREAIDRIGEGGGEANTREKPHKSCRRHVGNGADLGGAIKKKRRQEKVRSVAVDPDNLENININIYRIV